MKSLLKKRLPGILAAGLVTLAVGAASAPASAAPVTTPTIKTTSGAVISGATVSGLRKNQIRARKRALKRCARLRPARRKATCRKQVVRRYKKISKRQSRPTTPPIGKTWTVDVGPGGDFYTPSMLNIKLNDAINWSWARINGSEPHNVTLVSGPSGVSRNTFASQLTSAPSYRFKRQFVKTGAYSFVCNIHTLMTMSVNVTK